MRKDYSKPTVVVVGLRTADHVLQATSIRWSDELGDEEYAKEQVDIDDINLWDREW